jgi:transcriptional regulator with XRE-family HTH domain
MVGSERAGTIQPIILTNRPSTMPSIKSPNPIDKHVGNRLRMRRMMLKMSQEKVGNAVGVSFQQIQKYEKGTNRMGASRLQQIAEVLSVPVPFFFEGMPRSPARLQIVREAPSPAYLTEFLATSEGLALVNAFRRIKNVNLKRSLVRLVEKLTADDE